VVEPSTNLESGSVRCDAQTTARCGQSPRLATRNRPARTDAPWRRRAAVAHDGGDRTPWRREGRRRPRAHGISR
jgi:hypothetical protein